MLQSVCVRTSCALALAAVAIFSVDTVWARGGRGGGGHGGGGHHAGGRHAGGHSGGEHHAAHKGGAGHGGEHHGGKQAGKGHQAGRKHAAGEHHANQQHHENRHADHRDGQHRAGEHRYDHRDGNRDWNHHYGWRGRHYLGANNWWWGGVPVGYAANEAYAVPDYMASPYDETDDSTDESTDDYASDDEEQSTEGEGSPEQLANNGPLPADATDEGPLPSEADRASIHVVLPDADATVTFDGRPVNGHGVNRLVMTPVIEPGSDLRFELTATWLVSGEPRTQTRDGVLRTGDYVTIDFTKRPEESSAR